MTRSSLMAGMAVLALFAFSAREAAATGSKVNCQFSKDDDAAISCDERASAASPLPGSPDEALYGVWQNNRRVERERAYEAAKAYLEDYPQGVHAPEIQAWTTAFEKVKPHPTAPPAPANEPPAPAAANPDTTHVELTFWQSIEKSTDPADFQDYLNRYPNGTFASIASRKIVSLQKAALTETEKRQRRKTAGSGSSMPQKADTSFLPPMPPQETITIDGTTYIKGREPRSLGPVPITPPEQPPADAADRVDPPE